MNVYPTQFHLPEVTAHVVALLERRRLAFERWDEKAEAELAEEVDKALAEAGLRFAEVADDKPYWARLGQTLKDVALPRYFRLAKAQHALELTGYGAWRGGDFLSRAAYAGFGLLGAFVIWRTPIPDWMEPLPLAFFLGGPLLPDVQAWWHKRKYAKQLSHLVEDMRQEAVDTRAYQPLSPVDEGATRGGAPDTVAAERERTP